MGRAGAGSPRSAHARPRTAQLPVAVDDARAIQVVGRQLAAHAVAGEDADAKPTHLAGHVAEHGVAVVQLDAEHRVGQGLDDLALELDLLLLGHVPSLPRGGGAPGSAGVPAAAATVIAAVI